MVTARSSMSMIEDPAWAHFRRLLDSRQYDEAEAACRGALEAKPGDFRWRLGLSLSLLGGKKHDLALRVALTLVNDRPDHPESYRTLALAWLALGKKEVALKWATLARQKSPTPEYDRFLERVRLAATDQVEPSPAPAPGSLSSPAGLPAVEDWSSDATRVESTRIVKLDALKAAVRAPKDGPQRDLVTQIFQRSAPSRSPSLPPTVLLEAQIHRLFGASLFGVWDTSTRDIQAPSPADLRKATDRRKLWAGLALTLLIGAFGAVLVRQGVVQRSHQDAQVEVDNLAKLVESGSLAQAAELLPKVELLLERSGERGTHRAVLVRAHAAIYRHHDADPARRTFVEKELGVTGLSHQDQRIAQALIVSAAERIPMLDDLQKISAERAKDAEPLFLIATALDASGDRDGARKAYRGAEETEPAYLAHAAFQVEFERRRLGADEVARLVDLMRDVHPRSPWTQLAVRMLPAQSEDEAATGPRTSTKTEAAPQVAMGVVVAEGALLDALALAKQGQLELAAKRLDAAAEAVHHEPPFLLDFATRLGQSSPALALRLETVPGWPRGEAVADALIARLQSDLRAVPADPEPQPTLGKGDELKPEVSRRSGKSRRGKRRSR